MFSPLEQFEVICFLLMALGFPGYVVEISPTNMLFYLITLAAGIGQLECFCSILSANLSMWLLQMMRVYQQFIISLMGDHLDKKQIQLFSPIIYAIFLIIALSNVFSLIPLSFALTSHFIITMWFSCLSFFTATALGIIKNEEKFLELFLPAGVPYVIAPFLVAIETISYFARFFSLGIRLFANIMAGHTLLKILSAFTWILVIGGLGYSMAGIVNFIIVVLITLLETAIALLQAYVFTTLTVIYISDALNLH